MQTLENLFAKERLLCLSKNYRKQNNKGKSSYYSHLSYSGHVYFGLNVYIGTTTFAAHTIAGNIETFSYMPGYGLAIAATTLVGMHIGARKYKEAYHYGLLTTGIAVIFMSSIGVIMFFTAPWMASWFTTDKEAIQIIDWPSEKK